MWKPDKSVGAQETNKQGQQLGPRYVSLCTGSQRSSRQTGRQKDRRTHGSEQYTETLFFFRTACCVQEHQCPGLGRGGRREGYVKGGGQTRQAVRCVVLARKQLFNQDEGRGPHAHAQGARSRPLQQSKWSVSIRWRKRRNVFHK